MGSGSNVNYIFRAIGILFCFAGIVASPISFFFFFLCWCSLKEQVVCYPLWGVDEDLSLIKSCYYNFFLDDAPKFGGLSFHFLIVELGSRQSAYPDLKYLLKVKTSKICSGCEDMNKESLLTVSSNSTKHLRFSWVFMHWVEKYLWKKRDMHKPVSHMNIGV